MKIYKERALAIFAICSFIISAIFNVLYYYGPSPATIPMFIDDLFNLFAYICIAILIFIERKYITKYSEYIKIINILVIIGLLLNFLAWYTPFGATILGWLTVLIGYFIVPFLVCILFMLIYLNMRESSKSYYCFIIFIYLLGYVFYTFGKIFIAEDMYGADSVIYLVAVLLSLALAFTSYYSHKEDN